MKNEIKSKVKVVFEQYKYNTLLTLVIFILFLGLGYSTKDISYNVYINNNKANLVHEMYTKNGEQYIHVDDLTNLFRDNVYNDKVSGKLIVTTHNKLNKIKRNDSGYIVQKDGNTYYNLKKIISEIEYDVFTHEDKIYVSNERYIDGIAKLNKVEVYDEANNNIVHFLNKSDKVKVQVNDKIKNSNTNIINIVVESNNDRYYGYVLKQNIQFEYLEDTTQEQVKKVVLVKADNTLLSSTDASNIDMVAINMYRLSGVNSLTKLDYTNNVPSGIKVFATINNGQKSSNYDADITKAMLSSETNRQVIIDSLIENTKTLAGVNIDFGNFSSSAKDNFTQFIKELAAMLHANNKQLIVNIPNENYIDMLSAVKYADYVVVQPYMVRTTASKTSGPISSVTYVEERIKELINKKIDVNKVILELPAYTILWTERKGTVINAEVMTMTSAKLYIDKNNIVSNLDNYSGQNYINYTKGITTYKMWLEDSYSIIQKTKLAKKYNLVGVSIYKSGMENQEIYKDISEELKYKEVIK